MGVHGPRVCELGPRGCPAAGYTFLRYPPRCVSPPRSDNPPALPNWQWVVPTRHLNSALYCVQCSQRSSPFGLFQNLSCNSPQGLRPYPYPKEKMSHTSRPTVPRCPRQFPLSPVVPLFSTVASHLGSLACF